MERQALRRVDEGDLSEDQEERIGLTLRPLGPLLPRAEQALITESNHTDGGRDRRGSE